ncbi:MAG TPA: hypothetical protein VI819_04160 [Patescibacteria group bacterium]|nr:hypothetical protein [Patescibacteria group bacterium]
MVEKKIELKSYVKIEAAFLDKFKVAGGLTLREANNAAWADTGIEFVNGFGTNDVIEKFLKMGDLEYNQETGKFIRVVHKKSSDPAT